MAEVLGGTLGLAVPYSGTMPPTQGYLPPSWGAVCWPLLLSHTVHLSLGQMKGIRCEQPWRQGPVTPLRGRR